MPASQRSAQMVNSYATMKSGDIIIDDPMPRQQLAKQQAFLRANHHNISPWMYTPLQIQQRNHALFLMEFDRCQKAARVLTE